MARETNGDVCVFQTACEAVDGLNWVTCTLLIGTIVTSFLLDVRPLLQADDFGWPPHEIECELCSPHTIIGNDGLEHIVISSLE